MGPARAFAFSVLVAKFPEAQLKGVKDVFSSETMSKLFTVMDDLMRDRRPAGAKPVSRNISSFIREQSMALEQVVLQYKKAVESLLGQEEGDGVRPFEGQFDKTAFGDKDIHDLLIPLAERDEAAELDAERRQEYMPRAFPRAQSNAVTAYAIAGDRALALRRQRRSRQLRRREHRQDPRLGQRNASHARGSARNLTGHRPAWRRGCGGHFGVIPFRLVGVAHVVGHCSLMAWIERTLGL